MIYHGDCREVIPALARCDLLLTDPPYGIALANHDADGSTRRKFSGIAGDESVDVGLWALEWACRYEVATIAFSSPRKQWPGEWRQWLVWDKGGGVGGGGDTATTWKQSFELIQVARTKRLNGGRDTSVLRFPVTQDMFEFHPAQKPEDLMRYLVGKTTAQGDLILDAFAGSGSTLVAAKALGRRAVGIEIEERYCEVAAMRLGQEVLVFEGLS